MRAAGLLCFGPSKAAAQLEGSKVFVGPRDGAVSACQTAVASGTTEITGVGLPMAVTVKVLAAPAVNVVVVALVIAGAPFTRPADSV